MFCFIDPFVYSNLFLAVIYEYEDFAMAPGEPNEVSIDKSVVDTGEVQAKSTIRVRSEFPEMWIWTDSATGCVLTCLSPFQLANVWQKPCSELITLFSSALAHFILLSLFCLLSSQQSFDKMAWFLVPEYFGEVEFDDLEGEPLAAAAPDSEEAGGEGNRESLSVRVRTEFPETWIWIDSEIGWV